MPTIRPPEALSGEVHPEKLGGLDDADVGLPEGGTRAWLSVLGVWLVQFANYGTYGSTAFSIFRTRFEV